MKERLELLRDLTGVFSYFEGNFTARYLLVIKPKNMIEEKNLEKQLDDIKAQIEN